MPMHRVIADEPFTVELPTMGGGAIYVRASFGEIEHITAVHPLVEKTGRTLLLVSTHAGFSEPQVKAMAEATSSPSAWITGAAAAIAELPQIELPQAIRIAMPRSSPIIRPMP